MKKTPFMLKLVLGTCTLALMASACTNEDEYRYRTSFSSFFTVLGNLPNYRLIDDFGNVFYPTSESVNQITENQGFTDKRIQVYGTYDAEKDVTQDESGLYTVRNVKLQGGQYIPIVKPMSTEELNKANLLSVDSMFPIERLENCWFANGYMNTIFEAKYSANGNKYIMPSVSLYAVPDKIKENAVTLEIIYNRHSSKNTMNAGTAELIYSYDISSLQIPGSDSVNVRVEIIGAPPYTTKVSRRDFEELK